MHREVQPKALCAPGTWSGGGRCLKLFLCAQACTCRSGSQVQGLHRQQRVDTVCVLPLSRHPPAQVLNQVILQPVAWLPKLAMVG